MRAKKSNQVIIRIWNSGLRSGANVGHISIEIPGGPPDNYMSLWPNEPKTLKNLGMSGIRHEFLSSPDKDIEYEGRPPEKVYCLYTLDPAAIKARFQKISSDPEFQGWALLGNNILFSRDDKHSCASLAYTLLKAGGLYQIISRLHSSRVSSVVTPDQLGDVVEIAKQAELRTEPDTQKFGRFSRTSLHGSTENETIVTPQSSCQKITPSLTYGAGLFAVAGIALAIAARNESCPEILESICDGVKQFTG